MMDSLAELSDGVHTNLLGSVDQAKTLGLVSKKGIDEALRSASHYKAWAEGAEERLTPALLFGAALHVAVLEPEKFAERCAVEPDFGDCRFKENKARRDEWREVNKGRIFLSELDMKTIRGMIGSLYLHPKVCSLLSDGIPKVTVKWTDEATGLTCKARADYYREDLGVVVDLKSTLDAREVSFVRSMATYGYHRQEALCRRGFASVGQAVSTFVFIAVEKEPPYAVGVYVLDDEAVARGSAQTIEAMQRIEHGLRTGEWPGYDTEIKSLSLPTWAA